jgi:CMP-2-keto-3-deoxyoctulosonic acid synthetase
VKTVATAPEAGVDTQEDLVRVEKAMQKLNDFNNI